MAHNLSKLVLKLKDELIWLEESCLPIEFVIVKEAPYKKSSL